MLNDQEAIQAAIQKHLKEKITLFSFKGQGFCNNAYYLETQEGNKYIVKQEKSVKEFHPQNSLLVEAAVARQLYDSNLSIPTPKVIFTAENPDIYGYYYIDGDMLIDIWPSLSEQERIEICSKLGHFHAEIGQKISKDMSKAINIKIDMSSGLHPEVEEEYNKILSSPNVPDDFKSLAKHARKIFDQTLDKGIFQFIHNDSHHENIIIKNKKISGIIDFGNSEYGEIAKEFSRYIRDFPTYFKYIISSYEQASGHKLSMERLVTNALLSGLMEIILEYHKGGQEKTNAEKSISTYRKMIDQFKIK